MARIGIDIDDTITDSTSSIKKAVKKYENQYSNDYILSEKIENIVRGFFDHEVIIKFFLEHGKEIASNAKLRPDVKEIIKKLKEDGHEIIFITARSNEYYTDATKFCENYLNNHQVIFDKVITGQTFKIETCKKENIDIMIDDGVDTCADLNKAGIKALLYSTEINENKNTISQRVYSWKETYEQINEYLKEKNIK